MSRIQRPVTALIQTWLVRRPAADGSHLNILVGRIAGGGWIAGLLHLHSDRVAALADGRLVRSVGEIRLRGEPDDRAAHLLIEGLVREVEIQDSIDQLLADPEWLGELSRWTDDDPPDTSAMAQLLDLRT